MASTVGLQDGAPYVILRDEFAMCKEWTGTPPDLPLPNEKALTEDHKLGVRWSTFWGSEKGPTLPYQGTSAQDRKFMAIPINVYEYDRACRSDILVIQEVADGAFATVKMTLPKRADPASPFSYAFSVFYTSDTATLDADRANALFLLFQGKRAGGGSNGNMFYCQEAPFERTTIVLDSADYAAMTSKDCAQVRRERRYGPEVPNPLAAAEY